MKTYLHSMGINNALGASASEVYRNLFLEKKVVSEEARLISQRTTLIKKVSASLPDIPQEFEEFRSRNNQLLLQAVKQILPDIEAIKSRFPLNRIGVILGTSTSGIQETEKAFISANGGRLGPDFCYSKQEIADPSRFLSGYLGLPGIHYTLSTACTSSGKALIEARRLILSDLCDAVVVGGVDAISSLTLNGFDSLDSVSQRLTNPFSRNRDGINIGEGAAVFILSREESSIEFLGYGESSDAYHASSPDPEGHGAELALRAALKAAGLSPSEIGYVNLHGTGTPKNDEMESKVTRRIFGLDTPVSSTKPFLGHTLGAASAQEAALCYLALSEINSEKLLPIHHWDEDKDPSLPELHFVTSGDRLSAPYCMSNSFAFGGNNVSLIFGSQ